MSALKERPVIWEPTPKQAEFLACPAREALFGGSVGAGKSDALLAAALSQTGNRLHRALILRRSFPQLRDLIARSHELYRPLGGDFNKQDKQWTFPSGSVIEFGYLDAPEDRFNYQGRSFSFLGFDELTLWPGDSTDASGEVCNSSYVYLLSRLRAVEDSGLRLEVRATCTPGGVGHGWVKQRFGIGDDGGPSERIDAATGYRRCFIPGRIEDNKYLAGTEYSRFLDTLPEADRKTLKLGRWDAYVGAVFSEWDSRIHVCEGFPVPVEWDLWRACDNGYASPACVLWLALDKIHDRVFVVDELYRSGLTPEAMARAVLGIDRSLRINIGGEVIENDAEITGIIDSASFADVGLVGATGRGGGRADIMNRLGCQWRPSEKGDGSRLAGKAQIHQRLALKRDGWPGLVITRNRTNLIRTLQALCYSKTHPEDIDTDGEDHCVDALRYGLTRKVKWGGMVKVYGI